MRRVGSPRGAQWQGSVRWSWTLPLSAWVVRREAGTPGGSALSPGGFCFFQKSEIRWVGRIPGLRRTMKKVEHEQGWTPGTRGGSLLVPASPVFFVPSVLSLIT